MKIQIRPIFREMKLNIRAEVHKYFYPEEDLNNNPIPRPSNLAMFEAMSGWISQFEVEGKVVGGKYNLYADTRLNWFLKLLGGAKNKRILELGPMEGAHSKRLCDEGAKEIIAIEGFRSCWLRCLVTKEIFDLHRVKFLYGDFCKYVVKNETPKFDFVLAMGVFYHLTNSARLIRDLAKVSDTVLVWSQVADSSHPKGRETEIESEGRLYRGRFKDYGNGRYWMKDYNCGVDKYAVWLYRDELLRAFKDAGFLHIVEAPAEDTPNGPAVLFIASKQALSQF